MATPTIPDLSVWGRAVDLYNKSMTKDPKKRIDLTTPYGASIHPLSSLDQLIDYTREAKERAERNRWKFSKRVDDVLLWFNQHATVVDVMIQHQPHITAIVWGGIRALLSVAIREIEVSDKIASSILDILQHIGRWETYFQLWPTTPRLSTVLVELFAQVINFLVRATAHYRQRFHKRYINAAFSFFNEKLEKILERIRLLAESADKEAQLASQLEQREQFKLGSQERERQNAVDRDHMSLLCDISKKCDHLTACATLIKNNREDKVSTIAAVMSYLQSAQASDFQDRQDAVVKWLRPSPSATFNLVPWEQDTCGWIKHHRNFKNWHSGGWNTPLWIHGIPGCGKSVLASYLTQDNSDIAVTQGSVFAYFFQKSRDSSNPADLVCSFLVEGIRAPAFEGTNELYEAIASIEGLMDRYPSGAVTPLDMTWRILESLMAVSPGFALIVDGIDECCNSGDAAKLLRNLSRMAELPQARIIVSSRYLPSIHQSLGKPAIISIEADEIATDIQVFVKAEIERAPQLAGIKDILLTKCSRHAHGMFLWARLMVDAVKSAPNIRTQKQVLARFPPGLDSVYAQFIKNTASGLNNAHLKIRRQLFSLIVGSFQFLTVEEISTAITLDVFNVRIDKHQELIDIENQLNNLCAPLVVTTDGTVRLIHASVKDYLTKFEEPSSFSMNLDADTTSQFMVTRCLCMLMLPEFEDPAFIADLLRQSMNIDAVDTTVVPSTRSTLRGFYKYAAFHWHLHLIALPYPSLDTLRMVARFFKSLQFVTWAESLFLLHGGRHGAPAMEVASYLKSWLALQPPSSRRIVQMNGYVESSYYQLAREFQISRQFPLELAFLQSRLAEYYAWTGDLSDKAFNLLVLAASGLEDHLGSHRMTLVALDALATGTLVRGLHDQAAKSHANIRQQRSQVLGPNHREVYMSMSYECLSLFHVLRFPEAQKLGEKAARGLLATGLPTARVFLHNQLYLGYTLEGQNKIEEAMALYESAYKTWLELNGPYDPSTLMTQAAMASTYRKLGRLEDAENHYSFCFAGRQRAVGLDNYVCVDLAISLAYVYRELQRYEEATALMELCLPLETLKRSENFERVCQIKHFQALLLYGQDPMAAEYALFDLMDDSRDHLPPANREMMWVRVTLAGWLRKAGKTKDVRSLFKDVVMPVPPLHNGFLRDDQCEIAEEAVKLVKSGIMDEARALLGRHGMKWVRDYYFDIIHGGPLTDTAWERGMMQRHNDSPRVGLHIVSDRIAKVG